MSSVINSYIGGPTYVPTTTSSLLATATPTETGSTGGGSGSTGPSSPLLFFVALGFGVVFTNLWIIVGVKYCFRYNQRNRARLNGEDPDGVDLNAMPRQRRRREKKLMTIDEVNEKFPLAKYKIWRSARADQGLPTAGGITNVPSRPASIKHESIQSHDDVDVRDQEIQTPATSTFNEKPSIPEHGQPQEITLARPGTSSTDPSNIAKSTLVVPEPALLRVASNEDGEGPDVIQTAIPPEQLPDPGDACAICIDTIEDDDDIRGLSCGHAFHASCVDPWLTSRRACCPLCKADYYVPKPRPEPTAEEVRILSEQQMHGPFAIMGGRYGNRRGRQRAFSMPGVFLGSPQPRYARSRPSQGQSEAAASTVTPEITTADNNTSSWRSRLSNVQVPALSRIRRGRGNEAGEQPAANATANPTPAQLESGRA